MRILTVVGARPQFIKSLPVSLALQEVGLEEILVHTGQHYDHSMSGQFFEQLGLPQPRRNLAAGSGSHAQQTAAMLVGLEAALLEERPDALLIYGDTNSTVAAALAAVKVHVPIAHVEAGLRNGDLRVPEEVNRVLSDRLSRWLFTPTQAAQQHLLREGTHPATIYPVGDVMLDAFLRCSPLAPSTEEVLGQELEDFILCTVHRPHHTDDPQQLGTILDALGQVAKEHPVVFPVHPRTRAALARHFPGWQPQSGLHLVEPLGYLQILGLLRSCRFVICDSGGLQKEAFFAGKRCIVLNHVTEWVELLQLGWNVLQPPDSVPSLVRTMLEFAPDGPDVQRDSLYGGGQAARRIAHVLAGERADLQGSRLVRAQ